MNNDAIVERLDILISLMVPPFEEEKYGVKGIGLEILKLADGTNSSEDIVKKVRKKRNVVDNYLSILRKKNFIKSISKNSKTYYIRIK